MFAENQTPVLLLTEDPMLEVAVRHLLAAELAGFVLTSFSSFEAWRKQAGGKTGVILVDLVNAAQFDQVAATRDRFPGAALLCWCSPAVYASSASLRGICDGVMSRTATAAEVVETLSNAAGLTNSKSAATQPGEVNIQLTYRESQLVALLARGYKNKDIATCLGITPGTVKVYLSTLFKKTGAKDRLELSLFGLKNSLFGSAEVSAPPPATTAARRVISRPVITSMRLLQPAPDVACTGRVYAR